MLKVALKNVKEILLRPLPESDPFPVSLVFLLLPGLFKLLKVFKNQYYLMIMFIQSFNHLFDLV